LAFDLNLAVLEVKAKVLDPLRPKPTEEGYGRKTETLNLLPNRGFERHEEFRTAIGDVAELCGHEELDSCGECRLGQRRLQAQPLEAAGTDEDVDALQVGRSIGRAHVERPDLGTLPSEFLVFVLAYRRLGVFSVQACIVKDVEPTGRLRMMTDALRSRRRVAMRPPKLPAPQIAKFL
jgi:hypothetical protein